MKIKLRLAAIAAILLIITSLQAQESTDSVAPRARQPISVRFDVRADWENHFASDDDSLYESAFTGKYINFMLDGNINSRFSYHLRYRFNRINSGDAFFNAIDWAYLNYDINANWRVAAGKQVVGIGGFEYDKAPIDVYMWSGINGEITCYELGVSGQYTTNDGRNTILAQVCNSPFASKGYRFDGLYAFNLMWYGNYGVFNSIWSANMIQYDKNKYVNYIVLGNQFNFGPVCLEIDYMNRYCLGQTGAFFGDFSLIGKAIYNIKNRANIFVKGGIDYNYTQNEDLLVAAGSRYAYMGAGVEFFPIKDSKDVRLHAYWTTNNSSATLFSRHTIGVGFKWLLHAFEVK